MRDLKAGLKADDLMEWVKLLKINLHKNQCCDIDYDNKNKLIHSASIFMLKADTFRCKRSGGFLELRV